MKPLVLTIAIGAAALAATPVFACGGDPTPQNRIAGPSVKAALRAAYTAAHPSMNSSGPVAGRTYYGGFGGDDYAVAKFVRGGHMRTATLMRHPRGGWRLLRESSGAVCSDYVPLPLIQKWSLVHDRGRCFTIPG
jgi:hypothetical protein